MQWMKSGKGKDVRKAANTKKLQQLNKTMNNSDTQEIPVVVVTKTRADTRTN